MYWQLFEADVPVKALVYNKVGHGDFVTTWPPLRPRDEAAPGPAQLYSQLQPYAQDLWKVVASPQSVDYVSRRQAGRGAQRAAAAAKALQHTEVRVTATTQ